MVDVTVECAQPETVMLRVSAQMTLGQWEEIAKRIDDAGNGVKYYAPLNDLLLQIRVAVNKMKMRVKAEPEGE